MLVNDDDLVLTEYFYERTPHYAVLSHTWGPDSEEVSFRDMERGTGKTKKGWQKLLFCAREARRDGLIYSWVDTCCIDTTNNNELTEAITSMYRWYRSAVECYVYLADVPDLETSFDDRSTWNTMFERSRWFTRGWTLQELIAPSNVKFYSQDYMYQGDKEELEEQIQRTTKIPVEVLRGADLGNYDTEEKMSWTKGRKTRRVEDGAYCLLGLFGIFMPLIYGEGKNAFIRLKEQISLIRKGKLFPPLNLENVIDLLIVEAKPEVVTIREDKTNDEETELANDDLETDQTNKTDNKDTESASSSRMWRFDKQRIMSLSEAEKFTTAEIVVENCQKACWHVYSTFSLWRCKYNRQDPDTAPKLFETMEGGLPRSYTTFSLQAWLHKIMHAYDQGDIPPGSLQTSDYKGFLSTNGRTINVNIVRVRVTLKEYPDNIDLMVENFETQLNNGIIFCKHFGDVESHLRLQRLQYLLSENTPLIDLEQLFPPDSSSFKPPSSTYAVLSPNSSQLALVKPPNTEDSGFPSELPVGSPENNTINIKTDD